MTLIHFILHTELSNLDFFWGGGGWGNVGTTCRLLSANFHTLLNASDPKRHPVQDAKW